MQAVRNLVDFVVLEKEHRLQGVRVRVKPIACIPPLPNGIMGKRIHIYVFSFYSLQSVLDSVERNVSGFQSPGHRRLEVLHIIQCLCGWLAFALLSHQSRSRQCLIIGVDGCMCDVDPPTTGPQSRRSTTRSLLSNGYSVSEQQLWCVCAPPKSHQWPAGVGVYPKVSFEPL